MSEPLLSCGSVLSVSMYCLPVLYMLMVTSLLLLLCFVFVLFFIIVIFILCPPCSVFFIIVIFILCPPCSVQMLVCLLQVWTSVERGTLVSDLLHSLDLCAVWYLPLPDTALRCGAQ